MRKDQWSVTVSIDGFGNLGVFDKCDAGEVDSDTQTWNPGGMGPPISLGGSQTPSDVTISRLYVLQRDHPIMGRLMNAAGLAQMKIVRQPLDTNKVPFGSPIVQNGVLKRVSCPEHDSNSSDGDEMELIMTPGGLVA